MAGGNGRGTALVVDDDPGCRALIVSLLDRAGLAAAEAANGKDALDAVALERPALVLLDVGLPDVNGYEVCRELKDRFGDDLPVVFVSGERTEPLDVTAGLLIGAEDYITKPFEPDEFLGRVRRAITRSAHDRPPQRERSERPRSDLLTRRELHVLRMLAAGQTTREIAAELVISQKTVATHLQRVLVKLGVNTRVQAVAIAYREGLVSVDRSEPAHDTDSARLAANGSAAV
jgi:DNA-binding NarL/FixJ family response regulator